MTNQPQTHQPPMNQQQQFNGPRPPAQYSAPFVPAPASTRRPAPWLHLVAAGLLALGLVLTGFGVRQMVVEFGNAFMGGGGESGAGALLWMGAVSILGGIIAGGIGRWLDSVALRERFSL